MSTSPPSGASSRSCSPQVGQTTVTPRLLQRRCDSAGTAWGCAIAVSVEVRLFKEPVSAITHFAGFLAALVGLFYLVVLTAHDGPRLAAATIYGLGLISVFLASSTLHFFDIGEPGNHWLRQLDHIAIFMMIGGTYVPASVMLLDGGWQWGMLGATGILALAGTAMKLLWVDCPRLLGTGVYLAMGWMGVVPAHLMLPQLSSMQLLWLLGGGGAYTIGAIIYASKRPDPWPEVFGFHEIWHIFVLLGAALHFCFVASILALP
jgi:hemolysin III